MAQQQMLRSEVLEEILRERTNYYFSKKKQIDFWLLISPPFLSSPLLLEKIQKTNFYEQHKELITVDSIYTFSSVLISTDKEFIKWIKLRLGYFENIMDLEGKNSSKYEYAADGIYGFLDWTKNLDENEKENEKDNEKSTKTLLISRPRFLHPGLLIGKYKKVLDSYYKLQNTFSNKIE
jgi:hypothetical protein